MFLNCEITKFLFEFLIVFPFSFHGFNCFTAYIHTHTHTYILVCIYVQGWCCLYPIVSFRLEVIKNFFLSYIFECFWFFFCGAIQWKKFALDIVFLGVSLSWVLCIYDKVRLEGHMGANDKPLNWFGNKFEQLIAIHWIEL